MDYKEQLKAAQEKRGQIAKQVDEIFSTMKTENRSIMSPEEEAKWNSLSKEMDASNATIDALEKRAGITKTTFKQEKADEKFSFIQQLRHAAGIEVEVNEVTQELSQKFLSEHRSAVGMDQHAQGLIVLPYSQVEKRDNAFGIEDTRHYVVQKGSETDHAGAHVVDESLDRLRDPLFQGSMVDRLGFDMMTGLVGDLKLPYQNNVFIAEFEEENATAKRKDSSYSSITMKPHRITAYTVISKQLMLQDSAGAEAEIMRNIRLAINRGVDKAIFGKGGNSVLQFGGFFETDPTVSGALAWDTVVDMETAIKEANYEGSLKYVTNSTGNGIMKKHVIANNTMAKFMLDIGQSQLNGYPLVVNNWIPKNLQVGLDESGLLLLDPRAYKFARWGGLEIQVIREDMTLAMDGMIGVVVNAYVDFGEIRSEGSAVASFKGA